MDTLAWPALPCFRSDVVGPGPFHESEIFTVGSGREVKNNSSKEYVCMLEETMDITLWRPHLVFLENRLLRVRLNGGICSFQPKLRFEKGALLPLTYKILKC